jgi:hypothetical protein
MQATRPENRPAVSIAHLVQVAGAEQPQVGCSCWRVCCQSESARFCPSTITNMTCRLRSRPPLQTQGDDTEWADAKARIVLLPGFANSCVSRCSVP